MNINFNDIIQLLEQDLYESNGKSFSTIITLPVIKYGQNVKVESNNASLSTIKNKLNLLDVFDLLHIQTIYRNIHANDISYSSAQQDSCGQDLRLFLALRNIEIKKEYQQQGICTKLIQCLLEFCQKHKINFWIDDVVNDDLYHFLMKQSQNKWNKLHYLNYVKPNIYYNDNLDRLETEDIVLRCFYAILDK